ncbi:MAG TPA: hypothetical protein PL009_00990 [Flavipsychrobacter sp.]|nr:hypothetical protein [Flavipsychrobacter sp.]
MGIRNLYPLWDWSSLPDSVREQFIDYSLSLQSSLSSDKRKFRHFIAWTFNYGSHSSAFEGINAYGGVGLTHFMRHPVAKRVHISLRTTVSVITGGSSFINEAIPGFQSLLSVMYQL